VSTEEEVDIEEREEGKEEEVGEGGEEEEEVLRGFSIDALELMLSRVEELEKYLRSPPSAITTPTEEVKKESEEEKQPSKRPKKRKKSK
jgi:hypothetical protein